MVSYHDTEYTAHVLISLPLETLQFTFYPTELN